MCSQGGHAASFRLSCCPPLMLVCVRAPPGERPRVRPLPALYILERLLHVTRATAFTQRLAAALTLRPAPLPHPPRAATPPPEGTPPQAVEPLSDRLQNGELGPGLPGASSDDEDRGQVSDVLLVFRLRERHQLAGQLCVNLMGGCAQS